MFKKSLRKNQEDDGEADETEMDNEEIEDLETIDDCPGSPGMKIILDEEKAERSKPPSNEKYNRTVDVRKSFFDLMPQCNSESFEENLEALSNFAHLMRLGLSDEIIKFLKNHKKYKIVLKEENGLVNSSTSKTPSPSNDSSLSTEGSSLAKSSSELPTDNGKYMEIPEKYRAKFAFDAIIVKQKGDGACFFSSSAEHLYGGSQNMKMFSRLCHQFFINCFIYYQPFIEYPFNVTVGVGNGSKQVTIHDAEEHKSFLRTEESLYSFATHLDMQNVANLFNVPIHMFLYNLKSTSTEEEAQSKCRWTTINPDPLVVSWSNKSFVSLV